MSFCSSREPAVHGIGAGDVHRVALEVAGGVHEQQVAVLHLPARGVVVQHGGVRPGADDRGVAPAHRAARQIRVLDRRLDLVLEAAGRAVRIPALCASLGDVGALLHHAQLVRRLHLAQVRQDAPRVGDADVEEPLARLVGELERLRQRSRRRPAAGRAAAPGWRGRRPPRRRRSAYSCVSARRGAPNDVCANIAARNGSNWPV